MIFGIGIDTGGTYTDAVIYNFETGTVAAKAKSPTTHHDLSLGIGRALDALPEDLLKKASIVSLSTTLATNACVENKGGRAKLVLVGTEKSTLERVGADKKYGLNYDDVLCVESAASFDGRKVEQPDWEKVIDENHEFFSGAEALGVAGLGALKNGGVTEISARDALTARYNVPFVMASELAAELNIMERGATALLNARLLVVIGRFMDAVDKALKSRGINCPRMIVRSDGGLMTDELARQRPVETILSGPAASVMGSRALADCEDCLIVDMGGTTTDISVVKKGAPEMSGGISIGGWRTQIKGVYIDTIGLGGDTRVYMDEGKLRLDTRRVEPLCSLAARWPSVKESLENLLPEMRRHTRQLHEFLYLVRMPENMEKYTDGEKRLLEALKDGPQMIGSGNLESYGRHSDRLEREGVVMRAGLTPTDIMHVRGDYAAFDGDASRLAARCFLKALSGYEDEAGDMERLCDDIYAMVKRRMFENIARVLIENGYPDVCKNGVDAQLRAMISRMWENRGKTGEFFSLAPMTRASLIGTGAPIRIFLPDVAKALGMPCIIPENSEVSNAVGAVVADINAAVTLNVSEGLDENKELCFVITGPGLRESRETMEEAVEAARTFAQKLAESEARRRGAMGEITITVETNARRSADRDGNAVNFGTEITALATGRIRT